MLTALPFGRGRLFRAVRGKPVPDWAQAFAGSWAQFFLKYLLADERVTAVIPGTSESRRTWRTISARCAAACPIPTSASGWLPCWAAFKLDSAPKRAIIGGTHGH